MFNPSFGILVIILSILAVSTKDSEHVSTTDHNVTESKYNSNEILPNSKRASQQSAGNQVKFNHVPNRIITNSSIFDQISFKGKVRFNLKFNFSFLSIVINLISGRGLGFKNHLTTVGK